MFGADVTAVLESSSARSVTTPGGYDMFMVGKSNPRDFILRIILKGIAAEAIKNYMVQLNSIIGYVNDDSLLPVRFRFRILYLIMASRQTTRFIFLNTVYVELLNITPFL